MNLAELPTLEEVEREIGLRGSFHDFVKMAWEHAGETSDYVDGWHVGVICGALERLARGEIRNIVVNIPPGCMKSTLVAVFWPVWCWIRNPSWYFFATSYSDSLVHRDSAKSMRLINSPWFRARWGDLVKLDPRAAVGEHRTAHGGTRLSMTVAGGGTGFHPDVVIIDDPIKAQDVTPVTLAAVESYWNVVLRTRNPTKVRRVLIMQRLAVRDLAGIVMGEGDWHTIILPMRYEPGPRAYALDPRRTAGELLWPERFPEETVQALERMPPRDRAAQLQQRPVPEGGAIIKEAWIRWYKEGASGVGTHDDPGPLPTRFDQELQSWDLTFKKTASSDFVAGQLWAVMGANYYLLDGILERLDFVGACTAILKMSEAHPGVGVLVEDTANGPAVMSMLGNKLPGLIAVKPDGGKEARLNACSPLFEAGNVWLPVGHPIAEALAISLVTFPVGEHDDDVDACSQLLNHLYQGFVDYAAAMANIRGGRL